MPVLLRRDKVCTDISTIVYMFVGILMFFVWPVVQNGIYALEVLSQAPDMWEP